MKENAILRRIHEMGFDTEIRMVDDSAGYGYVYQAWDPKNRLKVYCTRTPDIDDKWWTALLEEILCHTNQHQSE